jgi:hypothetical protein
MVGSSKYLKQHSRDIIDINMIRIRPNGAVRYLEANMANGLEKGPHLSH